MKFVEVEMTGGLGNQLFKWANGFRISQELNATLVLNTSFYERLKLSPETSKRLFELNQFPLINLSFIELRKRGFLDPRLQALGTSTKLVSIIGEDSVDTSGDRPYSLIKGNFESLKYLPARDIVREMFDSFQSSDWLVTHQDLISQNEIVAIHVRLGDFLNLPEIYNILPERYYIEAIQVTRAHFPNADLWLFTDDINEAEKIFPNLVSKVDKIFCAPEIQPREILRLMSMAKAIVCANSTFSWWASFLAKADTLSIIPSRFNKISGDKTAENLKMSSQVVLPV